MTVKNPERKPPWRTVGEFFAFKSEKEGKRPEFNFVTEVRRSTWPGYSSIAVVRETTTDTLWGALIFYTEDHGPRDSDRLIWQRVEEFTSYKFQDE